MGDVCCALQVAGKVAQYSEKEEKEEELKWNVFK